MPNRTIYLPADVDRLARQLDVNLSRLTQDAIRALAAQTTDQKHQRLMDVRGKVAMAGLTYPSGYLRDAREQAGDDLR
jgi:post-segregation antitoxin (ccd killing protein)